MRAIVAARPRDLYSSQGNASYPRTRERLPCCGPLGRFPGRRLLPPEDGGDRIWLRPSILSGYALQILDTETFLGSTHESTCLGLDRACGLGARAPPREGRARRAPARSHE